MLKFQLRSFGRLGADEAEEEDVCEADCREYVAEHVSAVVSYEVLHERDDTAADYHHHEEAGSLVGRRAEAFDGESEDCSPHH